MGRNSGCAKQKLRKGLWSPEEDEKLYSYISRFGVGCWSSVPKLAGLERCGKSCRLRWINYLRPDLKKGMFSQEEEDIIIQLHQILGNRWAQISSQLPGRTDNEIKNFWNSCLKKKLMKQGIDPQTHQPVFTHSQPFNNNNNYNYNYNNDEDQCLKTPTDTINKSIFQENDIPSKMQESYVQNYQSIFMDVMDPHKFSQNPFQNLVIENLQLEMPFTESVMFSNETKECSSNNNNNNIAGFCWGNFDEQSKLELELFQNQSSYGVIKINEGSSSLEEEKLKLISISEGSMSNSSHY